ncbi:sulfur carrier protein ThiS [Turneriella parva]|uniref:Thiamine biosynthesis protein ThiS n=1 Tax=Turneriella parva (strain ATCC BAA-1111 / DSM 21527 / NCTC 11395 / H) TaxID=869212 RepID=I4BB13_TURPD|nr:sulfur carrier protein ThiS [Turneriella parva]AFM14470.1 thiamine biosynthesis protein ThiS [Turneriella parva DSM 21527]
MTVNGENIPLQGIGDATLAGLIAHLKLSPNRIAVELNGELVDRLAFASTTLNDSDVLELIHYVGGG